jgi:hypothetical protein
MGSEAALAGRPTSNGRALALFAALGVTVATQAALALGLGAAPGAARDGWPVALALCLLLALPAAGLIWAVWAARDLPVRWPLGLAVAAAGLLMRAPYLGAGPMLEDDHFRYLLDGAMLAQGFSPYAFSPQVLLNGTDAAPHALVEHGRAVIAAINFPELRSMYPGGAEAHREAHGVARELGSGRHGRCGSSGLSDDDPYPAIHNDLDPTDRADNRLRQTCANEKRSLYRHSRDIVREPSEDREHPIMPCTARNEDVVQIHGPREAKALILRAAEETLLDASLFRLSEEEHAAFVKLLDDPPKPSEEAIARYRRKPVWGA